MDSIIGILFRDWFYLLKKHHFKISPRSWLKSLWITYFSLMNIRLAKREKEQFKEKIENTKIKQDPVFIIGHWRSGTTFLHNLISQDERFAFVNTFEGRNPHTFLSRQDVFEKRLQIYKETKRVMDNIQVGLASPVEEEFLLAILTLQSPLIGWLFPQNREYYDRYITYDNVSEQELKHWKNGYLHLVKKLTFKYNKQLLLKSPLNTARIHHLIDMFPNAKFIHIHRNPYNVFKSTLKLFNTAVRNSNLINTGSESYEEYVLAHYKTIYDSFFQRVSMLNNGCFCEIAFENLESKPVETIQHVYTSLNLDKFDRLAPTLQQYVKENADYKKNVYDGIPEDLRVKIRKEWRTSFEKWQYEM